jgi:N-ethylmaleimide reductase
MITSKILSHLKYGKLEFKNRVFMAPMTRSRAPEQVPTELMMDYYTQRASAGLIFTEGSQVSTQGVGYVFTPGIHTTEQIKGWKKITDSVHEKGGLIFCQLWHVGRVSHPDFHHGDLPVAPSAISFKGQAYTVNGLKDVVTPRPLTIDEIKLIVDDFKNAALAAKEAGFDGVEIHGANGYLPAQFLEDGSNHRSDLYGGSIENRARFILEITDAVIGVWGPERVSVRLSPRNPYNGMSDSHPEETYLFLIDQLEKRKLGLLHFMSPAQLPKDVKSLTIEVRKIFSGLLILNSGYDQETAEAVISRGEADAVSFGTLFIANPDLPDRFEKKSPLASPDRATMYGGHAKGYTDYPNLGQSMGSDK